MKNQNTYTTEGKNHGSCGHTHRSIRMAKKCIQKYQSKGFFAGCDRKIVPFFDGRKVTYTDLENWQKIKIGRFL